MAKLQIARRVPSAALAAVPDAVSPSGATSPALIDAIARARTASAIRDRHYSEQYEPAREAWQRAVDQVPHVQTLNSYASFSNKHHTLSTDDIVSVALARSMLSKSMELCADYRATAEELVAADDARTAEFERLRQQHSLGTLVDENNELSEAAYEAIRGVADYPVTTLTDLIAKLDYLSELGWLEGDAVGLADDVRRIAKGA